MTKGANARVRVGPHGLDLGGRTVPLISGSVHYFRLARNVWRPALTELARLGARLVDVYVPWGVHETGEDQFDFGERDPRLDVVHFLELAHELGLHAIVRPGPHINAELTFFGIPERVVWNEACQARSPTGARVVLPTPPLSFPVPSYASRAFHEEAGVWLRRVARVLSPLRWPEGPIVLLQVDNEGALYFRDGPYDQDYHPDAIEQYRRFVRHRYKSEAALATAYGDSTVSFSSVEPPRAQDAKGPEDLARHLDWAEFQDAMLSSALYRFRTVLAEHGLDGIPTFHNLPLAEAATPLDAAKVEHAVDFVALDYYHHASEKTRREIARRTSWLAGRSTERGVPAFAAEMGAGFAPYFPPLTEADNRFTVLTALAYGLRGLNAYMAVARDRWIGGPIDARGRARPSAEFWTRLFGALSRTRFHELTRRTPVRLAVPRSFERLVRVCHAFGPVPPTAFALGGEPSTRGGLEGSADPSAGAAAETETFLRDLEALLEDARIPFEWTAADLALRRRKDVLWTIVACPGGLDPELTTSIGQRMFESIAVSVGPRPPERSGTMGPHSARLPSIERPFVPMLLPADETALAAIVHETRKALRIPSLDAEPFAIQTTLHEDASGTARVLFVINATDAAVEAVASAPGARSAADALTSEPVLVKGEHVVLPVGPRSVRMLELSPTP
jgi:beta-galactosidase